MKSVIRKLSRARWMQHIVMIPPDADDDEMQALRAQLEARMNEVTRRAYTSVGCPGEGIHA